MIYVGLFLLELIVLFILSGRITQILFNFFYRITKNKQLTIHLLAFIFLPGTFIHEISHFITSLFLLVPAGNISLIPKNEGNGIKMGSVSIAKTDPIRRLIIGIAPVIIGILIISAIFFFVLKADMNNNLWINLLLGYIIFEIGNTMFSSKKDMEGSLEILLLFTIIGIFFYFLGIKIPFASIENFLNQPIISTTFHKLSLYLLLPIISDAIFILFSKIFFK